MNSKAMAGRKGPPYEPHAPKPVRRAPLYGAPVYTAILALALLAGPATAGQRPLPDLATFLPEVRARLHTDGQRQYNYRFVETRREARLDDEGRATDESVTVIDSHPGFPGEPRWERVLVRDGEPVSQEELREQDEERRRETEAYLRREAEMTDEDRARREREWDEWRRELADTVDDVFRIYDIEAVGREPVDGHDTIVLTLDPRDDVDPVSRDGRWFRHFAARVWISETDFELVRLEVEALDDVNLGWGLLARIHEGTTATFERRRLDGDVWLPARTTYTMSGRFLLLRRVRTRVTSEYSDYRRAEAPGSVSAAPRPPDARADRSSS